MLCVCINVVYSVVKHFMLYFGDDFRMKLDGVENSSKNSGRVINPLLSKGNFSRSYEYVHR